MRAGLEKESVRAELVLEREFKEQLFCFNFFLFFFANSTHLVVGTWWCDG